MDLGLPGFKAVSIIFAMSALATGAQAIVNPLGFSKSFGLPLSATATQSKDALIDHDKTRIISCNDRTLAMSYVSLMGVRQLATGIILLTFAYQDKWTEMATILVILGIVVAGTDGIYLSRGGARKLGRFHAVPGAMIAALAGGVLYSSPRPDVPLSRFDDF